LLIRFRSGRGENLEPCGEARLSANDVALAVGRRLLLEDGEHVAEPAPHGLEEELLLRPEQAEEDGCETPARRAMSSVDVP
jgi:hypothetical protein